MQQHGRDERISNGVKRHQMTDVRAQVDDGRSLSHQALSRMDCGDETWAGHSALQFPVLAHRWLVAPQVAAIARSGASF